MFVACPSVASYLWTSTFARCVVTLMIVCFSLMLFGISFIALSHSWQTKRTVLSALLILKQCPKKKGKSKCIYEKVKWFLIANNACLYIVWIVPTNGLWHGLFWLFSLWNRILNSIKPCLFPSCWLVLTNVTSPHVSLSLQGTRWTARWGTQVQWILYR